MSGTANGKLRPSVSARPVLGPGDRAAAKARVRTALGFDRGETPSTSVSLRSALRGLDVGWYPLLALSGLYIVDQLQTYGLTVLGPEVAYSLGVTKSQLAGILTIRSIAVTLATIPIAAFVHRRARRGLLAIATGFAWALMTLFTGFVISVWGLLLVAVLDGASSGSVGAVHQPMLMDTYPPRLRVRVLSVWQGALQASSLLGPLLVAVLTGVAGFTWRGVFLISGFICLAVAGLSVRLRDPGYGRWDTERARAAARGTESAGPAEPDRESVRLTFFEVARRIMLIPTMKRILLADAVLGMVLVPVFTYLTFFLQERWAIGPGGRGVFAAGMAACSIAGLVGFARRGERMFSRNPDGVVRLAGLLIAAFAALVSAGVLVPSFIAMIILLGLANATIAATLPALSVTLQTLVPARMRPAASGLQGIFVFAVGGIAGVLLLTGADNQFGTGGAIVALLLPCGVIGGLVLRSAAQRLPADLDRLIDDVVEHEELRELKAAGSHIPLLACRHIDFAYGQLQVLFDVDFTVDEQEIVALLGTNGAGKSTLLRVISGLGLPSRGSVRLQGEDVTYIDAERRVSLGIGQIPGGKAVYGPLSVVDNLRVMGYSLGRNRAAVEAGIEASFNAFPRLAERRNQLASTLSGGEQQMLGLSTALITRPRLLLIDELSLGLAPRVVGELLDMVRHLNAQGAAVVLVEQSVNVALSIAQHAYFMEKGQIRFDGRSADLIGRPDLLRSVFLEGASAGLAATSR